MDWYLVQLRDGSWLTDGGMVLVFTARGVAEAAAERHAGKIRRAVRADNQSYIAHRVASERARRAQQRDADQ